MKKIVIIRGKVTAGKTTTSYELAKVLPGWIFVDAWKIKEMFEPLNLKDRIHLKEISKKAMILIIKEVIKNMGINIIVQETSQTFIKKYLRKELKKYNYEIYSFFLDVNLKDAVKRDNVREKPTMNINKDNMTEDVWKKIKSQPEKVDIIINTSNHNINEVINIILKNINEKRKEHPNAHLIRKIW